MDGYYLPSASYSRFNPTAYTEPAVYDEEAQALLHPTPAVDLTLKSLPPTLSFDGGKTEFAVPNRFVTPPSPPVSPSTSAGFERFIGDDESDTLPLLEAALAREADEVEQLFAAASAAFSAQLLAIRSEYMRFDVAAAVGASDIDAAKWWAPAPATTIPAPWWTHPISATASERSVPAPVSPAADPIFEAPSYIPRPAAPAATQTASATSVSATQYAPPVPKIVVSTLCGTDEMEHDIAMAVKRCNAAIDRMVAGVLDEVTGAAAVDVACGVPLPVERSVLLEVPYVEAAVARDREVVRGQQQSVESDDDEESDDEYEFVDARELAPAV
ncbi:hypothetical protein H9P43_004166 [Blastocladiella emersonii ATCC 22665]|nr:hypothetical protein H9P43_004166 [Blastocladiella emersonii ATCC 22665]